MAQPQPERLYRFMRKVGLMSLPLYVLVGVACGIAFGLVPGLIAGIVAVSLGLYQVFGFRHVNEWLRRRKTA